MSSGLSRVMVAVVAIPFFIAATIYGGIYFFVLMLVLILLGAMEAFRMAYEKNAQPQVITGLLFALLFAYLLFKNEWVWFFPALLMFLLLVLTIELFRKESSPLLNLGATVFCVLYVSLLMGSLILLRSAKSGDQYVFLVFAGIWGCDTLAYYGGRLLGRHKLFERVSPKKTWEGAVTGFFGALLGVFIVRSIYEALGIPFSLELISTFVVGALAGTLGQIGDLAESLLKRDAQIKDSGTIIPGHGGVLDRFDSLLFVAPATYIYLLFFVP